MSAWYLSLDAIWMFLIFAIVLTFAIAAVFREGRNEVLEQIVATGKLLPIEVFCGTLDVAEYKAGTLLRMSKRSTAARRWQFWYRWIVGTGPQPIYDQVTFDRSRALVELQGKKGTLRVPFHEIAAIRMREIGGGRDQGSTWILELLREKGGTVPLVASMRAYRKFGFDQTAPVARAVCQITGVLIHVSPTGLAWTLGWPPKSATDETYEKR